MYARHWPSSPKCDIEVVEEKSQESIVEEGVAEEGEIMVVLE